MKVKVVYRKTVEEEVEVDDKYYALTDEGGFNTLSYKETDDLMNGIIAEIERNTEANYDDICYVDTLDGETIVE